MVPSGKPAAGLWSQRKNAPPKSLLENWVAQLSDTVTSGIAGWVLAPVEVAVTLAGQFSAGGVLSTSLTQPVQESAAPLAVQESTASTVTHAITVDKAS